MSSDQIETREVYAKYGTWGAMGYKFRCRVESKERGFFKKRMMYRAITEKYFMSWENAGFCKWRESKEEARKDAVDFLDSLGKAPEGEYL